MRGSFVTALQIIISIPSAVATNAILARLLHPAGYGTLAYLSIAFSIAAAVSELGVPWAVVQWGSAAEAQGDQFESQGLLSRMLGFRLMIQTPLLAMFGVWLLRGQGLQSIAAYLAIVITTAAVSAGTLGLVVQNRTASVARIAIVGNIAVQASVVLAALTLRDPVPVWLVRTAAGLVVPLLALVVLEKHYRRAAMAPRFPRNLPSGFWRFATGMGIAGLLTNLVFTRSEILVLGFYGQTTNLGLFALAFGLSQWLTGPVDAMLGPLVPASAALIAAHPTYVRRALLRSLRFSSLISGGLLAGIVPTVFFLIPVVYSGEFAQAALLFLPLGVVSTFQSLWNPSNALLLARRRSSLMVRFAAVALILDLGTAIAAIPFLGAWGAVLASVVAQTVWVLLFAVTETRTQGIGLQEACVTIYAWAAAMPAMAIGLLVGASFAGRSSWEAAAAASFTALFTYVILIRLCGGVLQPGDTSALVGGMPSSLRASVGTAARLFATRTKR